MGQAHGNQVAQIHRSCNLSMHDGVRGEMQKITHRHPTLLQRITRAGCGRGRACRDDGSPVAGIRARGRSRGSQRSHSGHLGC